MLADAQTNGANRDLKWFREQSEVDKVRLVSRHVSFRFGRCPVHGMQCLVERRTIDLEPKLEPLTALIINDMQTCPDQDTTHWLHVLWRYSNMIEERPHCSVCETCVF